MELSSKASDSSLCYPDFSLVIEWENILLSEKWRTVEMLRQLSKQIVEISPNLSSKPEVIIVYDSDNFEHCQVEQFVNQQLEPCSSMIDLRIISAPSCHYYQQKNVGAKQCSNGITIFFDSDCIPDDGWLIGILESFNRPDVSVVSGHTYMPLNTLMEKAFALFWYFPPETYREDVFCEKNFFFANNVAFLTNIFQVHNFAELPQFRRSCVVLGDRLRLQGYKILCQPKSRTYHPAPNGLQHFVAKALSEGHDIAIDRRRTRKVNEASMPNDNQQNRLSLHEIFSHIRRKYRSIDLSRKETVCTLGIVFSYFLFMYIGFKVSSVKPELILRHLKL